ncbi:uncharacterized protein [Ptychodera flava]|uniref:uncharacterized protein n=1 Tax=Ptychodera flava TaxID=63121 RepID=UPI00396A629E
MKRVLLNHTIRGIIYCIALFAVNASVEVRLSSGMAPFQGKVEVRLNGENSWKYMCRNGAGWNLTVARAVCKQLGYFSVMSDMAKEYSKVQNIAFSVCDIECNPHSASLRDCTIEWNDGGKPCRCSDGQAAAITCFFPGFLGRYRENHTRVFPTPARWPISQNHTTIQACVKVCRERGKTIAVLESADECHCGDDSVDYWRYGEAIPGLPILEDTPVVQYKTQKCAGDLSNQPYQQGCGGDWQFDVYNTSFGACGGHHTDSSGYIYSPNFPGNYINEQSCTWTITVDPGHIVKLTTLMLRLQDNDLVIVKDGIEDYSSTIATFTSSSLPKPLNSSSNELLIQLNIGSQGDDLGFIFRFEVLDMAVTTTPIIPTLQPTNYTTTLGNYTIISTRRGITETISQKETVISDVKYDTVTTTSKVRNPARIAKAFTTPGKFNKAASKQATNETKSPSGRRYRTTTSTAMKTLRSTRRLATVYDGINTVIKTTLRPASTENNVTLETQKHTRRKTLTTTVPQPQSEGNRSQHAITRRTSSTSRSTHVTTSDTIEMNVKVSEMTSLPDVHQRTSQRKHSTFKLRMSPSAPVTHFGNSMNQGQQKPISVVHAYITSCVSIILIIIIVILILILKYRRKSKEKVEKYIMKSKRSDVTVGQESSGSDDDVDERSGSKNEQKLSSNVNSAARWQETRYDDKRRIEPCPRTELKSEDGLVDISTLYAKVNKAKASKGGQSLDSELKNPKKAVKKTIRFGSVIEMTERTKPSVLVRKQGILKFNDEESDKEYKDAQGIPINSARAEVDEITGHTIYESIDDKWISNREQDAESGFVDNILDGAIDDEHTTADGKNRETADIFLHDSHSFESRNTTNISDDRHAGFVDNVVYESSSGERDCESSTSDTFDAKENSCNFYAVINNAASKTGNLNGDNSDTNIFTSELAASKIDKQGKHTVGVSKQLTSDAKTSDTDSSYHNTIGTLNRNPRNKKEAGFVDNIVYGSFNNNCTSRNGERAAKCGFVENAAYESIDDIRESTVDRKIESMQSEPNKTLKVSFKDTSCSSRDLECGYVDNSIYESFDAKDD